MLDMNARNSQRNSITALVISLLADRPLCSLNGIARHFNRIVTRKMCATACHMFTPHVRPSERCQHAAAGVQKQNGGMMTLDKKTHTLLLNNGREV